ncbi:MAG TPA: VWA domain-containing protein [Nannocystis exedens]|nr:VWA domain-containing protein [Nannocystis exedens]
MSRRLSLPLTALLLSALPLGTSLFSGCAGMSAPAMGVESMPGRSGEAAPSSAAPSGPAMAGSDAAMADSDDSIAPAGEPPMPMVADAAASEMPVPESAEEVAKVAKVAERKPIQSRPIQVASLTAGTFDDTLNPATLQSFARTMLGSEWTDSIATVLTSPLTVIQVVDTQGRPLADVGVTIQSQRSSSKTLRSGTDGRVVIIRDWDLSGETGSTFMISASGQHARVAFGSRGTQLIIKDSQAQPVRSLDLALVIDATGSMGDEIEYLKAEIANIAGEVARAHPDIDQRYALVVYRDKGDAYVTRDFNFTGNLHRFTRHLSRQQADGGGDYPEAMDRAMLDAAGLQWRDQGARMLFLVADAPPHPETMGQTLNTVEELRGQGVAIYPIAASGVADSAELVMRASAAVSGGEYIFLTDDSGVGNSHAEPHIPCYTVQSLRNSMLRAIESELAGQRIDADPKRTIRQVGSAQDGVCVRTKAQIAG